jgi:hypothetical protein
MPVVLSGAHTYTCACNNNRMHNQGRPTRAVPVDPYLERVGLRTHGASSSSQPGTDKDQAAAPLATPASGDTRDGFLSSGPGSGVVEREDVGAGRVLSAAQVGYETGPSRPSRRDGAEMWSGGPVAVVVNVQPQPPLAGRERVWEAVAVSELAIFDALDRDHPRACRGRAGGWCVRVPGLLRAALVVGLRALARCAALGRGADGQAAAGALRWVRDDACALAVVAGAASARRGAGDRRGAVPGCRGRRASPDRAAAGAPGGHGPRLARCRAATRREAAGVRAPTAQLPAFAATRL